MPARRPGGLVVTAAVLLALGALVAQQVGAALGLRYTPVTPPVEHLAAAPVAAAVAPPAIGAIVIPDDPRMRLAAGALADAYAARGVARPAVTTGPGPAGALRVTVGSGASEAYTLANLTLSADSAAGAAAGLYQVADRVRAGAAMPVGRQAPALGLRLADAGAVGLDDDPARFATGDDYSLNTDIVGSALLPAAPWVDPAAVATIDAQFKAYVNHTLAAGYNGVVLPGFLEYVTFGGLGVYPPGDPHVARARAMVAAFGPVWKYAHDMGMKVYLQTDMLAVSPPLKKFLGGEGGGDYKLAGWDYTSEITVTTVAAVRAMLRAFLAVASPAGKDVIFRTWSVGVGAVGDLHTNPASYATVFQGLDDPHLIVSTKYSLGDFYSHLPVNDTLFAGPQKRIVEFQSRREFEGLGALPDDLGDLEQQALRTILAKNPNVIGVWDWTQNGGPLYAGGRSLYLRDGFWQLYDLNVYLTARLAWDPATDVASATTEWIRSTFSDDPATVAAVAGAFARSRDAITQGLYIGPYADHKVSALGLEPPPMMWIFEWDIVTGDSAALDSVYAVSRDRLDEAIAGGAAAVGAATRMRDLIAGTAPATWRDPSLRARFVAALDDEVDLLGTLSAYREMALRHVEWLDTGSASARSAWTAAEARYETARAAHVARYAGDLTLPAYNFTAADIGVARADRDQLMAWLAPC